MTTLTESPLGRSLECTEQDQRHEAMDRWVPNSFLWVVKNLDSGQVHAEHLMAFTFCSEKNWYQYVIKQLVLVASPWKAEG